MKFSTVPVQEKIIKPWGYEILYTPKNLRRTGKILFITAGKRLSFQYHDEKEETLCLFSGGAMLWIENADGQIEKKPMEAQKGYTIVCGQKHRVEAIEDSFVIEVSDPERGNTYRVEDDFARTTETEVDRQEKHRGWKP